MELKAVGIRTRTIVPFPDVDPGFKVTLRKLSPTEAARLQDRAKLNPFSPKPQNEKLEKALRDIVLASVVRVEGGTSNGVGLEPEADDTKLLLLEAKADVEGELVSLWTIVTNMAAEEERAELGNMPRPWDTSMATA